MRMYAFGKKDTLVVAKPGALGSAMGVSVSYTEPTLDVCYSKHGFALPLDYEGIPLSAVVTGKIPNFFHAILIPEAKTMSYILVKRDGSVWLLAMTIKTEEQTVMGGITYTSTHIYTQTEGWWLTVAHTEKYDEDYQMVMGLLKADPPKKLIDKHFLEKVNATKLLYLNIPEIVDRINTLHPIKKMDQLTRDIFNEPSLKGSELWADG